MNLDEIENLIIRLGLISDGLVGQSDEYELTKKVRIKRAVEDIREAIEEIEVKAAAMRAERDARKAELVRLGVENMKARS